LILGVGGEDEVGGREQAALVGGRRRSHGKVVVWGGGAFRRGGREKKWRGRRMLWEAVEHDGRRSAATRRLLFSWACFPVGPKAQGRGERLVDPGPSSERPRGQRERERASERARRGLSLLS
jgi:hypothetical protein